MKGYLKIVNLLVAGIICLVFLSACAQNSNANGNGNSSIPAGPIKIGVSLSLTGDDSADGQATEQGYEIWQDFVNSHGGLLGHQVQMVFLDDGTQTNQVRANIEKLITVDHVSFVMGPFDDPQTITAAEAANQHHMFLLDIAGTGPEVFQNGLPNLFAVSLSATAYFTSFVHYILSLPPSKRPKTAAYATSDDGFTESQIDSARPLLERGGVQTALYTKYSAENADPTGPAQKVVSANADIVLLGTAGLSDCAAFLKTFIQQHYNPKLVIAAAGPDQGQSFTQAIGAGNTEGLIVPNDGWWPESNGYQNSEFIQLITSKLKITSADISSDQVQAFSAGQVLTQAVNQAQTLDNTKIETVLKNGTFQSLQGPVAFDSTGQNKLAVAYLFQWQKGQLVPVFPTDQAMANVEYPKPAWTS